MDQQAFGAFLVVKILSKNQNGVEEYGCIPKSWVKVKDRYDNTVVFGYPSEDRIDTKLRVIEYQPLDTSWPKIFGEVVFHTDSQEEAFRFLDTRTAEHKSHSKDQSRNKSKKGDTEVKLPTVEQAKRKRGRPRKQKVSDQEATPQNENNGDELDKELELQILEAEKLIRTYASDFDDDEVVISSTPKILPNETCDASEETPVNKKIATSETTQIHLSVTCDALEEPPVNKQIAKKITQRPRRKSTRRTRSVLEGYQGFSDENCDRSDDSDYTPEIVRPEHSRPSEQFVPALDQEINMNLSNYQVYSECYNFYVELNDSYQKNISILDNAEEYLQNIISAHEDNVAATAKQLSPSPTSHQLGAINPKMFSDPQPLLQERCTSSIREEDTRWTVRYPEPGPDLIELIPDTECCCHWPGF